MTDINISKEKYAYLKALDSEYGFRIAKELLKFKTTKAGFRNAGTSAENKAADWFVEEMEQIGLSGVTKESIDVDAWEFHGATVKIEDPEFDVMHCGSFPGLEGTAEEGITGQVVYVGEGTSKDYKGIDVKDKIVLIDTDAYYTYWYNLVFEEAQSKGAKGIIATVTDRGPGTYGDELITIQDIQGFVDIPAVMMNKKDGELLRNIVKKNETIIANIKIDVRTEKNASAHYVYGVIEGKNPESKILYSAHYDAYWDGFLDNASACGTLMAIAKAMVESDYQPDSTIIFVVNGAEEYGRSRCAYDYCVGVNAIVKKHPEWVNNTKACFSFELTAHNQMGCIALTVTAGYVKWFEELFLALELPQDSMIIPTSISGADNIVFSKAGIPTCMNISTSFNDEDSESASNYDHTQYDNLERYDAVAFDEVNKIYGILGILIDKAPTLKLDFLSYMKKFWEGVDTGRLGSVYRNTNKLINVTEEFNKAAICIWKMSEERKSNDENWGINKILLEINRSFMRDIYKYNADSELIVGHLQPYSYMVALDNLIMCLQKNSIDAIGEILKLDNNYLITTFDKEVYYKTVVYAFSEDVSQEWAEGHTIPFPDLYDVIKSVIDKNSSGEKQFDEEIQRLKIIKNEQEKLLCEILEKEMQIIASAKEKLERWI